MWGYYTGVLLMGGVVVRNVTLFRGHKCQGQKLHYILFLSRCNVILKSKETESRPQSTRYITLNYRLFV